LELARMVCFYAEGNLSAAARHAVAAIHAFANLGGLRDLAETKLLYGEMLSYLGADEAKASLNEAIELAQIVGAKRVIGCAWKSLGRTHLYESDLDRAEYGFQCAIAVFSALNLPNEEAYAAIDLALVRMKRGELEPAKQILTRSFQLAAGNREAQAQAWSALAQWELTQKRPESARDAAERAMQIFREHRTVEQVERIRAAHIEALLSCERHDEARAAIAEAHAWLVARAAKIDDERLRTSYLTRIPENAAILKWSETWLASA
jgi:tetratricopeptide (TPR) repeat protein